MSILFTVKGTNLTFHSQKEAFNYAKNLLIQKNNDFNVNNFLSKPIYYVKQSNGFLITDEIADTISIEQLKKAIATLEEKSRLDTNAQKLVQTVELI